jgi:hypothetical protein
MKYLKNEKGIALITALLITLILLAIVLTVIYLITQGTIISGFQKKYQTAHDAAYGGIDITAKDLIPKVITGRGTLGSMTYGSRLTAAVGDSCFNSKLTIPTANWTGCTSLADARDADVKNHPDFTFTLSSIAPQPNFAVYAKIVETLPNLPATYCGSVSPCPAGNSSRSPVILEGEAVAANNTGMNTPQHFPFLYRIDIQAERQTNPDERANITSVYAY